MASVFQMCADVLAELVQRYAAALVLYARQWTNAPDDAVQLAFLKLVRLPYTPDNPAAWLYTVVRNAARDAERTERRRNKYETRRVEQAPAWFESTMHTDGLDREAAVRELRALPADLREIVTAHVWGELTFEQIGTLSGCSASTAFRRYNAGIAILRERLGEPCPTRN